MINCIYLFTVENGASGSDQEWVSKNDLFEIKQPCVLCAWNLKQQSTPYLKIYIRAIVNTLEFNIKFYVLCYSESSGFSKRRISSVSATRNFWVNCILYSIVLYTVFIKQKYKQTKLLTWTILSVMYHFQILKAPRKSTRFPAPEQQENVVNGLLDTRFLECKMCKCLKKKKNMGV